MGKAIVVYISNYLHKTFLKINKQDLRIHQTEKEEAQSKDSDLPGDGWEARAIFIYEVSPSIEDPAVVKGHQSVPCSGWVVLPVLTVCILERGELVFP